MTFRHTRLDGNSTLEKIEAMETVKRAMSMQV